MSETATPSTGHAVRRTVLVTQLVLALVTALVVVLFYRHLNGNLKPGAEIPHPFPKPTESVAPGKPKPTEDPLNILVLGSDSRNGKGDDIDGQTSIGQRADTTILLHISADRKSAYGVSIPRDALVTRPDCKGPHGTVIPGGTLQMFNAAFSLGGPACTALQVQDVFGVYVDHYVTVDFGGFKDMVDAIHGVEVCIPTDVNDYAHHIFFTAGTQTLSGQQALNYVRERYSTPNSDVGRMKRQQSFIASMIAKVVSAGTLTHLTRVTGFLNAATRSMTLDPGIKSVGQLAKLALQLRHTDLTHIKFITVPFEAYAPNPNRLVISADAAGLWKRINHDAPLGKKYSSQVISAGNPITPGTGKTGTGKTGTGKSGTGKSGGKGKGGTSSGFDGDDATANGLCS